MRKQGAKHIFTSGKLSGNSPGNSQGHNFVETRRGEAMRCGRALLCGMLLVLPGLSAAPAAATESAGRGVSAGPTLATERVPAPTLLAEERGAEDRGAKERGEEAQSAEVPAGEGERQKASVAENLGELENLPGLAISEGRVSGEEGPLPGAAKRLGDRVAAVGRGLLTPQSLLSVLSAVQSGTLGQHGEQTMQGFQDQMLNAVLDQGIDELRRGVEGNFLRNVELRYQTPLNGRSGQFSADAVFALVDQEKQALFGQVGALFGGPEGGFNLGLGYRHLIVPKHVLLGANFFFDYDTDSELQRISVGAEVRSRSLDLYMNWYHMIGGISRLRPGVFRYTPDGFDVTVAGRMPILPWVELSGRYYHWFLEKDDIAGKGQGDAYGFNYKIALQPMPLFGVEIALEDPEQGKREWGVSANLKYRFGVPLGEQLRDQRVKAHDPSYRRFERVRREYKVEVRQLRKNQRPSAEGRILAQSVMVGSGPMTVDVASNFSDPDEADRLTLTYTALSSASGVATASVSGSVVTITPVSAGSARVTVTATDLEGATATQTIAVTVANPVPTVGVAIAAQKLMVSGDTVTVDVTDNFSDRGDTLSYEVSSSNMDVARVVVSGSSVTITAEAEGSARVTVTATDTGGGTATQTIEVTVNRAPTVSEAITAQTVTVGGAAVTVDVTGNFSDSATDTLSYEASSNNNEVTVSVSGSVVTITAKSAGGAGNARVTVTATDTANGTVTQAIEVTVTNPAPTAVETIAGQTVMVGGAAVTVDVADNFSDSDTLSYEASSNNNEVVVSVSGSVVTITAKSAGGAGSATVTVTATDTADETVPQTIAVTVTNTAPEKLRTTAFPLTITVGGTSFLSSSLSTYFSDTDRLMYTVSAGDVTRVGASITVAASGGDSFLQLAPLAAAAEVVTVTVTATDTAGLTAMQDFSVTVMADPADLPTAGEKIADQMVQRGDSKTVDVAGHFSDTDALTYTALSSDTDVVTVPAEASGSMVTITAVATAAAGDTATVTVTATDTVGGTVPQEIAVTVQANQPPVGASSVALSVTLAINGLFTVAAPGRFRDTDPLTYTVSSNNPDVATGTIDRFSTFRINALAAGPATLTLTATDRAGQSAMQTFVVTVN